MLLSRRAPGDVERVRTMLSEAIELLTGWGSRGDREHVVRCWESYSGGRSHRSRDR